MGYPQTSIGVVGNTDGGFMYDSRFGNFYGVDIADGALNGLRRWDAYPNGKEIRARAVGDMGTTVYTPNTQTFYSRELLVSSGTSNSAAIYGYSMVDLTHTSSFGIISGSIANSGQLRILAPAMLCSFVNKFGQDIVVSRTLIDGSTTGGQELNFVSWYDKVNTKSNIAENHAVIGAVPDGSSLNAWALGFPIGAGTMHLYRLGVNNLGIPGVLATVGALTVAQIDATWTNVQAVYGITVDQTDGNLILGFSTTDAVTNRGRLVKLNSTTGAVMWSVPVAGNPGGLSYDVTDMAKNVVKNGFLYLIGTGVNVLFTINTITGAFSSQTFDQGILDVLHGHQFSEDVTGSIMWYGGWTEGTTHPLYVGDYCGTQGIHTGTHMGWRFWASGTFTPPSYGSMAASRKRAWSFVLDGHTFYVLDLGPEGTFAYDTSTGQWAQFITQGYLQWNFANGVMWGQRIVAGDMVTTDIWEMQPSALFDNGATEIIHTVTGGVATRTRVFKSVDAFNLACSVGQLQDGGAGASVTLSFSDDQGKTFTSMAPIVLTQGDFMGEIAWRSLGSFSSPGRIFKIVDTGGFLRIDGADVDIGGFDDPSSVPATSPGG